MPELRRDAAARRQLWKGDNPRMTRHDAYAWLASALEIPPEHAHIGMFDWEMCQRTCDEVDLYRHLVPIR